MRNQEQIEKNGQFFIIQFLFSSKTIYIQSQLQFILFLLLLVQVL